MIELRGVSKYFFRGTINQVQALRNLHLAINPGDFITVIGSNGAGKSTVLKALAGVIEVDEGSVLLDGRDVTWLPEHIRARYIGRIDQDPLGSTAPMMSIEENMAMASKRGQRRGLGITLNRARREHFRTLLRELDLGLEERTGALVGTLSGGQRQALGLLMATMGDPLVLLLDEHTAALDPKTALQVMEITDRVVARRSLTTLMVTHNMEQAIRWGNRLLMMRAGEIVLDIAGEEKTRLTVPELVERFHRRSGENLVDDRVLLAESLPR